MRLRTQLTFTVTALVALVVALAGLVIVVRIDHRDRADLDRVLTARAEQVRAAAQKNGSLPTDGSYAIRLIQGGEMLKQVGSSAGFPLPAKEGFSTVNSGDDEWRSLAQTLPTGAQLQILVSLDDLAEQHTDNVLIVDLLVLLAAVLSAAGVWFATGLVLRPFQRLLGAARELDPADPEQQLPEVKSPREVAELTATLNDLLARARSLSPAAPASTSVSSSPSESSTPGSPPSAVSAPTVEMRAVDSKHARKPDSPTSGPASSSNGSGSSTTGSGSSANGSRSSTTGSGSSASGSGSATSGPESGSGELGPSAGGVGQSADASESSTAPSSPTEAEPGHAASTQPAVPAAAAASPTESQTSTPQASAATEAAPAPSAEASATQAQAPTATAPNPTPAAVAVSPAVAELLPSLMDMGVQLDQLLDNPDMPATQRHLILAVMADEHRRMTALLDGDA